MDITPLIPADRRIIQGYGPGMFRVSGEVFQIPILVFPDHVQAWDFTGAFDRQELAKLAELSSGADVVLLGCGAKAVFITPDTREEFRVRGLSLEVMDSGAACRTYNVLMAEGRRVAAALVPLQATAGAAAGEIS